MVQIICSNDGISLRYPNATAIDIVRCILASAIAYVLQSNLGCSIGRQLSTATTALLQETPQYIPYANQVYGTGVDPFNLTLGGYYVSAGQVGAPTAANAYGKEDNMVVLPNVELAKTKITIQATIRD